MVSVVLEKDGFKVLRTNAGLPVKISMPCPTEKANRP